jgi:hypothetical protein
VRRARLALRPPRAHNNSTGRLIRMSAAQKIAACKPLARLQLGLFESEVARKIGRENDCSRTATGSLVPDRPAASGALMSRTAGAQEIVGGVDQRKMRKRLREVTQVPLAGRIIFFCKQAHIVAQRQ